MTVRDDGEGIEDKHLPRLTERFYRVNDVGGDKSGTGLGLAIVKHVVTRHRGELKITSRRGQVRPSPSCWRKRRNRSERQPDA